MKQISEFHRVGLGLLPTPLHRLPNLSRELGIELYVKRDDMTGVALGGNKVRKLEFLLADAMEKGCDYILTTGGAQSNHAMLTAMCCSRLGLKCILVLMKRGVWQNKGNQILNRLSGAEVRFMDCDGFGPIYAEMDAIAAELASGGHKAYVVPMGGSVSLGSIGYVNCIAEAAEQAKGLGVEFDHMICCAGSGGTHAGVHLGAMLYSPNTKVTGVSVSDGTDFRQVVKDLVNGAAELLDSDIRVEYGDVNIHDCYGPGYAIPSKEGVGAMKLMARREGIVLDPVYTGKTFAGLMQLREQGYIRDGEKVMLLHSGGAGGVFAIETE